MHSYDEAFTVGFSGNMLPHKVLRVALKYSENITHTSFYY